MLKLCWLIHEFPQQVDILGYQVKAAECNVSDYR